jgi:hypothetical protein
VSLGFLCLSRPNDLSRPITCQSACVRVRDQAGTRGKSLDQRNIDGVHRPRASAGRSLPTTTAPDRRAGSRCRSGGLSASAFSTPASHSARWSAQALPDTHMISAKAARCRFWSLCVRQPDRCRHHGGDVAGDVRKGRAGLSANATDNGEYRIMKCLSCVTFHRRDAPTRTIGPPSTGERPDLFGQSGRLPAYRLRTQACQLQKSRAMSGTE